jgi:hypothetical protein
MRSAAARPGEVVVEIDRLTLDGFGSLDREEVGRAVQAALASQIATLPEHEWGSGLAVDRLAGTMRLGSVGRERSRTVGSEIAGAVYGAVTGATSGKSNR